MHALTIQLLSQPAKRIARILGLRQGGLLSSYSQLFISFGMSCRFHEAQMFNVSRKDMGEFSFFMSQPLAIVAEDFVMWLWKKSALDGEGHQFARYVGYLWTLLWFSFCLHFYVDGLLEAHVMKDWALGYAPLDGGSKFAGLLI